MNNNTDTPHAEAPSVGIDDIIASLAHAHANFSQYIDHHWHDLDPRHLARSLAVHGRVAAHLGRMLRRRRAFATHCPPPVSIDTIIADLDDKVIRCGQYIDQCCDGPGDERWLRLLSIYSQNIVRLSQLRLDQRALLDTPSDEFQSVIYSALDQLSAEWGIEL